MYGRPLVVTTSRRFVASAVAVLALATTGVRSSPGAEPRMNRVSRQMLCVTEGSLQETNGRLSVNVSKMRAYLNRWTSQAVAARITYLGPTAIETKLASGETRRQFGLKLRAQDACNLVYAMWRIQPESELVVSVKTNPGQHASSECGNRGYHNARPLHSSPVPSLRPGDQHVLRAEMNGEQLRVFVDDGMVWDGKVGAEALLFDGPVGIRSDNVKLEMDLQSGDISGAHANTMIPCRSGPSEAE